MARGCSESDSEEERHDRFRSERNSTSLNASKSLYGTGLQQTIKSRSPFRRLNSPTRRDRRSPTKRSRSRSKRSKERKKSKERRESKEKSKKDIEKTCSRSSSKTKESRRSDVSESGKSESSRRSHSKSRRRSSSKDLKRKNRSNSEKIELSGDSFLQRFERRRPSVENEIVENNVVYRDSSPDSESQITKNSSEAKIHKKEKKKKRNRNETEEGELISEEENNCFGPALPPRHESEEEDGELKENSLIAEGPALPPGFSDRVNIGPILPEKLSKEENPQEEKSEEGRKEEKRSQLIGPTLPPRENLPNADNAEDEEELYGPALPPPQRAASAQDNNDGPLIGPRPQGMELDDGVERILEERAQFLRKHMENKDIDGEGGTDRQGRESWMLELPEVKNTALHLGLSQRKFRAREGPDLSDRSSWTDIPGKQNKEDNQDGTVGMEDSKRLEILARNEEMECKAKQASSHRDKSLLEIHQKELKKKRKKEQENSGGKEERRPFSREIDLQTNRFDEAQKRSIINKAQLLDTRFSSGESKYL